MNVIAHAHNVCTSSEFQELIFNNENVCGLSLNLIMTRDHKIIIYTTAPNNPVSITALEMTPLDEIKNYHVWELDEVLSYFQNQTYNKKIFLQLIPLATGPITDDTVVAINKQNYTYVKIVTDIIQKYPNLQIHVSSLDYNLIYYMKDLVNTHKVGVTISYNNLNYVDVDFYEFPSNMVDLMMIHQQLNLGKDVVVLVRDDNDISLLLKSFKKTDNALAKQVFPKIIFNTTYPEIFYLTFRE